MLPVEPEPKVDAKTRAEWNKWIQFLESKGMRGNPGFDHNPGLVANLMAEYKHQNPNTIISPAIVKPVQRAMNEYRNQALELIRSKKAAMAEGVSEDQFMNGLSAEDGIAGQKTTNWMFPEKKFNHIQAGKSVETKNFGLDYEAYQNYADSLNRPAIVSTQASQR